MKARVIWIVVILLLLGGAVYIFRKPVVKEVPGALMNKVSYFCDAGTINAVYTDNNVALTLSDGRMFSLSETISGSGTRYEQGASTSADTVFWSEGDNGFLTENNTMTYNNCVAGITKVVGTSTMFADASKTFSFVYPSVFTLSGGGVGYTQSWAVNATTSGMILAETTLPRSYMPSTNFAGATLTVGVSSDPSAIALCTTGTNGEMTVGTENINGTEFAKITGNDAGAGNFYDTTSYRTIKDGECYAVEYTIHSTDIGNYSPDQGITQFDESTIQGMLDGIVKSFKFL